MRLEAVRGDITAQHVDAIVNAANSSLLGGGGVDGAIHAAAGRELDDACRRLRADEYRDGLPTGEAVATTAGATAVAASSSTRSGRCVGSTTDGGAALLASCHRRGLEVADGLGAASVAFPAISCGAFGWSPAGGRTRCGRAVRDYSTAHPESGIALVRFVLFDESTRSRLRRVPAQPVE